MLRIRRFIGSRAALGISLGLALWLCTATVGPAATAAEERTSLEAPAAERSAPDPDAFCAIGACRPATSSPWKATAFGVAVIAMGIGARRESHAS